MISHFIFDESSECSRTCAARVVDLFVSGFRKEDICCVYLILNSFSVSPIYSADSIDALYMTDSVRHLFLTGHFVLSLQLHSFCLGLVASLVRILLLCLDNIFSMFSVQEYDNLIVYLFRIV